MTTEREWLGNQPGQWVKWDGEPRGPLQGCWAGTVPKAGPGWYWFRVRWRWGDGAYEIAYAAQVAPDGSVGVPNDLEPTHYHPTKLEPPT